MIQFYFLGHISTALNTMINSFLKHSKKTIFVLHRKSRITSRRLLRMDSLMDNMDNPFFSTLSSSRNRSRTDSLSRPAPMTSMQTAHPRPGVGSRLRAEHRARPARGPLHQQLARLRRAQHEPRDRSIRRLILPQQAISIPCALSLQEILAAPSAASVEPTRSHRGVYPATGR